MKILFLSKRCPQGRDLLQRPYGRFYFLPHSLAKSGHEVRVALLSHAGLTNAEIHAFGVSWTSDDLRPFGPMRYLRRVEGIATKFKPDWIVGFSDIYYGILAAHLGKKFNINVAIDAYDNYQAYMPWAKPLHWVWRRALAQADLVTAAGPQLQNFLQRNRGQKPTTIIPMAADPAFVAMNKTDCRRKLGLPIDAPLIGYSGGWARNRGTHILLRAFRQVQAVHPDTRLVLSGRPPADVVRAPDVIALGYLQDQQLPTLLNAVNVACVITANSDFGRYSYPAKLCEAMACGTPVAATATEPVRWMLNNRQEFLANVDDANNLAARILSNLNMNHVDYGPLPSWGDSAQRLEDALDKSTER